MEASPLEFRTSLWDSTRALLLKGSVACAVVSGEIVSTGLTTAYNDKFIDIGVYTHKDYRGRGLAKAAASIVAKRVQEAGRIPVWSAGEHNMASLRVARKLGFNEVSRRTYVILERLQ